MNRELYKTNELFERVTNTTPVLFSTTSGEWVDVYKKVLRNDCKLNQLEFGINGTPPNPRFRVYIAKGEDGSGLLFPKIVYPYSGSNGESIIEGDLIALRPEINLTQGTIIVVRATCDTVTSGSPEVFIKQLEFVNKR